MVVVQHMEFVKHMDWEQGRPQGGAKGDIAPTGNFFKLLFI